MSNETDRLDVVHGKFVGQYFVDFFGQILAKDFYIFCCPFLITFQANELYVGPVIIEIMLDFQHVEVSCLKSVAQKNVLFLFS